MYRYTERLVARGVYVEGILIYATYHNRLTGGRAELAPDGSLIIHSFKDKDAGRYQCGSEYRSAWSDLNTFGMYVNFLSCLHVIRASFDIIKSKLRYMYREFVGTLDSSMTEFGCKNPHMKTETQ